MAAMAITSILILIIVALTSRGVDIWRSTVNDVRTTSLARGALETMAKDFESMQIRGGNSFEWLSAMRDEELQTKTLNMGPDGAKFSNAARLVFFTIAADRNVAIESGDARSYRETMGSRRQTAGEVSCVGYKLSYRDQILNRDADESSLGFPVYALYRNVVPPYRTYDDILGSIDLDQSYSKYESDETRPSNFLAENIVELTLIFEIEYKERNESGNKNAAAWVDIRQVPIIATGIARSGSYRELGIYGDHIDAKKVGSRDDQVVYGTVKAVTIDMTVVTDEGMVLVDQLRQGRNKNNFPRPETFFSKYTRSFCQRIEIPKAN
jgi:hypothetical protein